ncbi:hypothetical protein B0H10DRAFT_1938100 [Mycena sp. CBHHK59/15]|nr:hypothetical protein B0H10DRAFT_1938100 [Mycena sp. CBHHK59/15]
MSSCAPAAAQKIFDALSHTNVTDSHHADGSITAARFRMDGSTGSQIGDSQIIQNILTYAIPTQNNNFGQEASLIGIYRLWIRMRGYFATLNVLGPPFSESRDAELAKEHFEI